MCLIALSYVRNWHLLMFFYFKIGDYLSPADSSVDTGISYTSSKLMSQEGVYQLTKDLRAFSEALTALKTVFLDEKSRFCLLLCCIEFIQCQLKFIALI